MKQIKELLYALGFEIDFEDERQNKIRFQGEKTFIDVWDGKKGITVGLYNPETKLMKYIRRARCEDVEDLVSSLK